MGCANLERDAGVGAVVEFRQARAEELPELKRRLEQSGGEVIDLEAARVWIALEDGQMVGMLSARMCWQLEPLIVFPEVKLKATRRRAGLGMYLEATRWLGNRLENKSGIHWFFAITRSSAVKQWADRLGWLRQYRGAATFLKYL